MPRVSIQPFLRLADRICQLSEKSCCASTVHHAMIARQRHGHDWAHTRLAIYRDNAIGHSSNGQNASLRRRDDGAEGIHFVHAQIAERKRSARNIGGGAGPPPAALAFTPTLTPKLRK